MISMRSLLLAVLIALCCSCPALAFTCTPPALIASNVKSHSSPKHQQWLLQQASNNDSETKNFPNNLNSAIMAAAIMTTSPLLFPLFAAADEGIEYEAVGLPPPYVPALFGVALLGGVALLTGSLGNVMDEEASLGMQSGARAKKEIERSRSSYFKKK